MSVEADNIEHERELETDNEQQIELLKAILAGIALIANVTPEELIELAKGL
jgi:hypothetical protein